jgi:hypothetical protein
VTDVDVRVSLHPDQWLTVDETEALEFSRWGILLESVPSIGLPLRHTADFTTTPDSTALVDASDGAVTATLHVGRAGETVTVINVGATGTVTVTAPDGYPGGSDVTLTSQWESISLRCYEPGSWLSST